MGWNGDDFKCFKFLTRKIRSEFRPIKNFATPESTPKCISENFEPERKFQTREILTQIWVMANLLFRDRFRMVVFLNLLRLSKWYAFNGTWLRSRKIILLKVIQTKLFWKKFWLKTTKTLKNWSLTSNLSVYFCLLEFSCIFIDNFGIKIDFRLSFWIWLNQCGFVSSLKLTLNRPSSLITLQKSWKSIEKLRSSR